ncbi:uncharacterized protein EV422DRAFT_491205 [Fimicolochytrium jonesii]|uniref:uncharacterized protein n=1 Tax=Fimicolochytrium jonesii TaxID=1396493 RepID=UPI0022FEA9B7|nr:uncharacterized protein EV422DRAFT_491205 [Fimicolochytrium jonesii]KAI8827030.1 hypothetical protein EV422DRAFT_491205 [Fimicolochytrium jonesii]
MCFYNMTKIAGLHYFPALTSLCIIAQEITEISGLEACPALERLWICETFVDRIKGLENCTELRELYLYSNQISKIEGLHRCYKIEKLWLSDNCISILENLQNLERLTQLQMGNNRLVSVGDALDNNVNLEELNISGNRISSFREVLFLARLPRLASLCLSDPNFADNPVCSLCNYQTHVIYHLPNLKVLDTLEVTEESRRAINATVLKKRMYYNMRIRTIKRNTNFLIKLLVTKSLAEQNDIEADIKALLAKLKRVQKRHDDVLLEKEARGKPPVSPMTTLMERLADAKFRLEHFIGEKSRLQRQLQVHEAETTEQIVQQSDIAIRKLLLELETGGNVRFEDGQAGDEWFVLCEALVKKMLKRGGSRSRGRHIKVHRISRIHNRYLKSLCDVRARRLTTGKADPALDYLWYEGSECNFEDVYSSVEYGFCDEDAANDGQVLLPNFVKAVTASSKEYSRKSPHAHKQLHQAIVVRAPLANAVSVTDHSTDVLPRSARGSRKDHDPSSPSSANSSKRSINEDDMPLKYIFKQSTDLLPEYFVEYTIEAEAADMTSKFEKFLIDLAFSSKLAQPGMPAMVTNLLNDESFLNQPREFKSDNLSLALIESRYPEVKVADDTSAFLDYTFKHTVTNDAPVVDYLNLNWVKIKSLTDQAFYTQIRSLSLSGCGLNNVPSLAEFRQLEKLDVSFNKIKRLQTLMVTPMLRHLDLAANQIADIKEFAVLFQKDCLSILDTRFNPVCKMKGHRSYMLVRLANLQCLDGVECSAHHQINLKLLIDHSSTQPHLFRPLSVRTQTGYGFSATQNEYWRLAHHPHMTEQLVVEALTTLELDSCNLFDLSGLPTGMVNLRWASFRNNSIRDVTKLAAFTRLEELTLENNELQTIEPLVALKALTKLDVSLNRIATIECAGGFQALMLLSIENNSITNLRPLADLPTLMELYAGNNEVADLMNIFPLRELPRLIILDFTGNAVCKLETYRLFTIYHLGKLKILDGTGISTREQTAAREAYLGKLTIELLGEKIGHLTFKAITELDLRNCKIREIDCFAGFDFRNLRKLTFDNNLLTNIDCFVGLVALRHLSLNNNRMERLLSSDLPAAAGAGNPLKSDPMHAARFAKPLLPNLEELHLGNNMITRIADLGLFRMSQLRILYLNGNRITKIDGLENMPNLMELVLDKNHIKGATLNSFTYVPHLKTLHVKENRIKSLAYFDAIQGLERLYMSNNRVNEISEIEKIRLPNLVELSLSLNAVARKQMYRLAVVMQFPQIVSIDSSEVSEEERQRAQACIMEQCMAREDSSSVVKLGSQSIISSTTSLNGSSKLPIKISSVVLDGERENILACCICISVLLIHKAPRARDETLLKFLRYSEPAPMNQPI